MRLIKVNDGKGINAELIDYTLIPKTKRPAYVIFSHRWLDWEKSNGGDVTFQEFNDLSARKGGKRTDAFNKLDMAIEMAHKAKATHIWIDSCCINRENNTELTESLNSMYQYYKNATKCLAYLQDCDYDREKEFPSQPDFGGKEWFKRGWTLQELIAPKVVDFYNKHHQYIGDRSEFAPAIHAVTKVPEGVLKGNTNHLKCSVAQRMSWAANRKTSREEDTSYSLLGLFNVNLTPLYGEGARKAFFRLQKAIMEDTNDMSIFAWKSKGSNAEYHGILARSPEEFEDAGNLKCNNFAGPNPEFAITNKGLRIQPKMSEDEDGTYLMPLNCCAENEGSEQSLQIRLSKKASRQDEVLFRINPNGLPLYVKHDGMYPHKTPDKPVYVMREGRWPMEAASQGPTLSQGPPPEGDRGRKSNIASSKGRQRTATPRNQKGASSDSGKGKKSLTRQKSSKRKTLSRPKRSASRTSSRRERSDAEDEQEPTELLLQFPPTEPVSLTSELYMDALK